MGQYLAVLLWSAHIAWCTRRQVDMTQWQDAALDDLSTYLLRA